MTKIKIIEIDPYNETTEDFENRVNKFLKEKDVVDIKFVVPTEKTLVCEVRYYTVMIMYNELTKEEEEAEIAKEQLKNYISYEEYMNKEEK